MLLANIYSCLLDCTVYAMMELGMTFLIFCYIFMYTFHPSAALLSKYQHIHMGRPSSTDTALYVFLFKSHI